MRYYPNNIANSTKASITIRRFETRYELSRLEFRHRVEIVEFTRFVLLISLFILYSIRSPCHSVVLFPAHLYKAYNRNCQNKHKIKNSRIDSKLCICPQYTYFVRIRQSQIENRLDQNHFECNVN